MSREIKESIVFYRSFYESIRLLPPDARLLLYEAITAYGLDQVEPDFTGVENDNYIEAVWKNIRPQLRANYQRWLNGGGGGAPKGSRNNPNGRRGKTNQELTENKPNIKEKEKEKEKGKENVMGTGEVSLTLPFDDPEFVETWNELRTQPKWRHKTIRALKMALTQLGKYDVRFAVQLMQTAIAGDYQGVVFPATPSRYEQWLKAQPQPQPQADQDNGDGDIYSMYNYE